MRLLKSNFLVIACITFIATVAVQSCKKHHDTPAGPSVTAVTSGAMDTVGKTYTLTITGANLTGASVSAPTGSGVTISGITATSTTITGTIAIGSTATPGALALTVTTSAGTASANITIVAIPLIGGYASSDSVAAANLLAYWPMDGDVNDKKGGITGTGVNVTYVTGVRGQAYQGSTTSYASFTPSAAMAAIQSFSVSVWYWEPAQPVGGAGNPNTPEGVFFLADANGADPLVIMEAEHYAPVSGDSLQIHRCV